MCRGLGAHLFGGILFVYIYMRMSTVQAPTTSVSGSWSTAVRRLLEICDLKDLKVSWPFLHEVQQHTNPKGVVALLTLSATTYKP